MSFLQVCGILTYKYIWIFHYIVMTRETSINHQNYINRKHRPHPPDFRAVEYEYIRDVCNCWKFLEKWTYPVKLRSCYCSFNFSAKKAKKFIVSCYHESCWKKNLCNRTIFACNLKLYVFVGNKYAKGVVRKRKEKRMEKPTAQSDFYKVTHAKGGYCSVFGVNKYTKVREYLQNKRRHLAAAPVASCWWWMSQMRRE